MLQQLSVSHLPGLPDVTFDFVPGLNVITGAIGTGKTLRTRDVLFLLLAGRIPSKRTQDYLGKGLQAGVVLDNGEGTTLSILRSGSNVRILEDPTASGSNAVKERVAMMTGIAAADLSEICYCSGYKLQTGMQLNSALMTMMRAVMGNQVSEFSQVVGSKLATVEAALASHVPYDASILEDLKSRIEKAEADLKELMESSTDLDNNLRICEDILRTQRSEVVDKRQKELQLILGPLSKRTREEVQKLMDGYAVYAAILSIVDELTKVIPDLWLSNLPILDDWHKRAKMAMSVNIRDPYAIMKAYTELEALKSTPVVTESDVKQAKDYIDWATKQRAILRNAQDTLHLLQISAQQEEAKKLATADASQNLDRNRKLKERLTILRECLLPSGKNSVEKQMISQVSSRTMAAATDYLCLCRMKAEMQYDPAVGIQLLRSNGVVKSCDLSEGEIMIAALCLRLAVAHTLKPVPFLVLDDVTGSMGVRAEAVTDMLRVFAAEHRIPIILNTQELRVTGDVFFKV